MNALQINNPATIRAYFQKVYELNQTGEKYPVSLDDVWPLVYDRKDVAVRALKKNFFENEDFEVFHQNAENPNGGRPEKNYRLTTSCLEYFIARKVREVFEVYRTIFHKAVAAQVEAPATEEQLLIGFTERTNQLTASKEVNSYNFRQGGKPQAVHHNRVNCFLHTGKTPKELMEWAKKNKVRSKFRTSAKEIIRTFKPAYGASMAFADDLCKTGKVDIEEAAKFAKTHALPLFQKMYETGMIAAPVRRQLQ